MYNPNNELWKIEKNGIVSYIFGTWHEQIRNIYVPNKCICALNSCNVLLSEIYGITSVCDNTFNYNNKSIIDILIILYAQSYRKQLIPLESKQEHNQYLLNMPHYPTKYYHDKYIIHQRNMKWLHYILQYINYTNTFISIGKNHVSEILTYLFSYGFKITKI
jgi:uncharacterized protein YbaP (TraB family)